jgi:hypothetical protein
VAETRKLRISGRRFLLATLRGIAELMFAQLAASRQVEAKSAPRFAISITAEDETLYEADSLDIAAASSSFRGSSAS